MAHPVVVGALGVVGEDFVGLPDDGELRGRSLVVVDVGVVLPSALTKGLLYLRRLGVAFDPEEFVEVHRHSTCDSMQRRLLNVPGVRSASRAVNGPADGDRPTNRGTLGPPRPFGIIMKLDGQVAAWNGYGWVTPSSRA